MALVLSGSNGISGNGINFGVITEDSGILRLPFQPSFKVHCTNSPSIANNTRVPFNVASYNIGNHFTLSTDPATSRFTAPVSGTYIFGGMMRFEANTTYIHQVPWLNGVSNQQNGELPGLISTFNGTGFCAGTFVYSRFLNAGDFIQFTCANPGVSPVTIHPQTFMYGYLVG